MYRISYDKEQDLYRQLLSPIWNATKVGYFDKRENNFTRTFNRIVNVRRIVNNKLLKEYSNENKF
jgi:hypothetical protein